jgi:CRP-like cAMP-binding protein
MSLYTPDSLIQSAPGRLFTRSPNKLLSRLPLDDYQRISPNLKNVPLRFRQVLHKQDEKITEVIFPGGGACSLTKQLADGSSAEVATVGSEGVVGAEVFFGEDVSAYHTLVQVPGAGAQAMPAGPFIEEMSKRGALYNLVVRYNQALMTLVMQTTVCNGLHSVEQRCCRWLVTLSDRIGSNDLKITHEVLATMLGVRRPSVTLVIVSLQRKGIVETHRGNLRIVDRKGLEQFSCECYASVRAAYMRLLPEVNVA